MNRRFDLKGWAPIIAAAVFGFVLGTTGVSVLWPSMWEGARLSDTLGLWGGILGGFMTLIAAIIAFRPARDQMLIAKVTILSGEIREFQNACDRLSAFGRHIDDIWSRVRSVALYDGNPTIYTDITISIMNINETWRVVKSTIGHFKEQRGILSCLDIISTRVEYFRREVIIAAAPLTLDGLHRNLPSALKRYGELSDGIYNAIETIEAENSRITKEIAEINSRIGMY